MRNLAIFIFIVLFTFLSATAQKVGVVFSGGGADGLSHIGVLKALEENKIPIDYISGTSMGAFIAAMYASGYSPKEIETLVLSEKFKTWADGNLEEKYIFYFKKKEIDANWISFKFSLDTLIKSSLPTNFVSPIPIDFGLVEMFGTPTASSGGSFDSLFIPFRCVASDITTKKLTIFENGDLGQSVRASMSYPFYIKPIAIKGKLYFDGGLYNNFPVDILDSTFHPDVIIGSNVSENLDLPSENDLISQIKNMLVNRSKNLNIKAKLVLIEPKITNVALLEFSKTVQIIEGGQQAALLKMDTIKSLVTRRVDQYQLDCNRNAFKTKKNRLIFENIEISGLNRFQSNYVRQLLLNRKKPITFEELKPRYYRLVADDKIKHIYPLATYNENTGYYNLNLKIKREKDIFAYFGGNFSSRPINTAFIGAQYNYLGNVAVAMIANSYFGKLYNSYMLKSRFDFPSQIPWYFEMSYNRNQWDFFKSSTSFFIDVKPSFLVQNENYFDLNLGLPAKNAGKIVIGNAYSVQRSIYYQTAQFTSLDTADRTKFLISTPYLLYERSTLNRKQYANSGTFFSAKVRFVDGNESFEAGSTSQKTGVFQKYHQWIRAQMTYDSFYKKRGKLRLGYFIEGLYSNQTFFNNYTASILAAQQFSPIPEGRTMFISKFRAYNYLAVGLRQVYNIFGQLDLRVEGFLYQPYQEVLNAPDQTAYFGQLFSRRYVIASSSLVFNSPIGPLSLSYNYYDLKEKGEINYSVLFSFGYLLFNKRSLD